MLVRFRLLSGFQRPVFYFIVNGSPFRAMLDTGALFPVFIGTRSNIEDAGGVFVSGNAQISGFGGVCTGDMYRMTLDFGAFRYADMPIVRTESVNMPVSFILSATMFKGFEYVINDRKKFLSIDTGTEQRDMRLRIIDDGGTLRVLLNE